MIKKAAFLELREQAIALRRAGRSRREIKELLGIGSNQTLNEVLKGEPPLPQNVRPNAKDADRAKARELRMQGLDYNRIAAELGVSKGSVSLWVRDLPRPESLSYEECRRRAAEGVRRYWAAERPVREAQRQAARAAAAAQIGPHGCLRLEVRRSTNLYRKVEGWAAAAMCAGEKAIRLTGAYSEPGIALPGEDSNLGRRDQNP